MSAAPVRSLAPLLLLLLSGLGACRSPALGRSSGAERLPPELARVLRDYEAAWGARDAHALAELFHADGFVLASGTPPVRGREAIEAHYRGAGGPLALRSFSWATSGEIGYVLGGYAGQAGEEDVGKFTLTLRQDGGGRWWIWSDMDNSNRRPVN
jgi:ketosteroid isomerase-like protein